MPDLDRMLAEANDLLVGHQLPPATRIEPVADPDTGNPIVVAHGEGRRYAIKACFRNPGTLERQLRIANAIGDGTGLPIPRHLCCATDPDRLPLMVMEFLPGEQLRIVLPALPEIRAAELARDWGRCVARFHHADIDLTAFGVPGAGDYHAGFRRWLMQNARRRQEALSNDPHWSGPEVEALGSYLAERAQAVEKPGALGLVKADQDVRDALALRDPHPHISAMLDWERVNHGDTLWEVAQVFVRLHLLGLEHLWPPFRQGYEREASAPIASGPHVECYAMVRALIAATAPALKQTENIRDRAGRLVRALLRGDPPLDAPG